VAQSGLQSDLNLVTVPGNPAPPGAIVEWLSLGDGVRLRTARWILPPHELRGTVVLLQGRTEFIEKYLEVVGELLARGLSVVTFDWRGQGLSSRQLPERLKGHVRDFSEFDGDLNAVMGRIVREHGTKPYYALAHSMGGNVLLRYLHDFPHEFERAVMTAPMLAVKTAPFPQRFARAMALLLTTAGGGNLFVFGGAAQNPLAQVFATNGVTSDEGRFDRQMACLKAEPGLALGAPTFGWLEAAYRSMELVASEEFAHAIETPVLLIGAAHDQIVHPGADLTLVRRIKRGMYVMLKAEHEIMMERDDLRRAFWACFDPFVGIDAMPYPAKPRASTTAE
jgi:lysophospholipase